MTTTIVEARGPNAAIGEDRVLDALRDGLVSGLTELSADVGTAAASTLPSIAIRWLGYLGLSPWLGGGPAAILTTAASTIGGALTKKTAAVLLNAVFTSISRTPELADAAPYKTGARLAREAVRFIRDGAEVPNGHLTAVVMELERARDSCSDARRPAVLLLTGLCYSLTPGGSALARERLSECSALITATAIAHEKRALSLEAEAASRQREADAVPTVPPRNGMVTMRGLISPGPEDLKRKRLFYEAKRATNAASVHRARSIALRSVASSVGALASGVATSEKPPAFPTGATT